VDHGASTTSEQNGSVEESRTSDYELQRRLDLKDEEIRLYRSKYEECNKQLLQAVRYTRNFK